MVWWWETVLSAGDPTLRGASGGRVGGRVSLMCWWVGGRVALP